MSINKPLHILLTRPVHQAKNLLQSLQPLDVDIELFPTIEIVPIKNIDTSAVTDADILIFTSANAVEPLLVNYNVFEQTVFAIGPGTQQALQRYNIDNVITPNEQFSSEGLLELPELQQVSNKNIVIAKGQGGREQLPEVLRQRGAKVSELNLYKRVLPYIDIQPYISSWQNKPIDLIISTSSESLTNLNQLFKEQQKWLTNIPLLVISERMSVTAKQRGFKNILQTKQTSDAAIVESVAQYQASIA